jgi:hypothetical protein
MRRRSRSSDEIEKLIGELDWSEEILSENVDGGNDRTVSRARGVIGRHASLIESFRASVRNINIGNKFAKKTRSSFTPVVQIKFPIEAFTTDNSTEFCNPDLFSEVYSMAYTSACEWMRDSFYGN